METKYVYLWSLMLFHKQEKKKRCMIDFVYCLIYVSLLFL